MLLLKICGITRPQDAAAAAAAGADLVGMIFVPTSPRCIEYETARRIVAAAPRCRSVCVVRDLPIPELQRLISELHPDVVQLHGAESPDYARSVRGAEVWKAVNLDSEAALAAALDFPAAMIVADSGGGTGRPCRWELAEKLARRRPTMLAGGLHAGNLAEAIRAVHPAGVDISSGAESAPGIKDLHKLQQITERIRS